jgi:hypothetical protein
VAGVAIAACVRPRVCDPFNPDTAGVSEASRTLVVELKDGDA